MTFLSPNQQCQCAEEVDRRLYTQNQTLQLNVPIVISENVIFGRNKNDKIDKSWGNLKEGTES